jgi:transcriptional regulator with XRE-family HTH domain
VAKPIGADLKRNSNTPKQVFGRAVTEMRIARELPQSTLAEALGYSTYYLGKIERGQTNVTCDAMEAISSYFNLSIGQFWSYAEKLSKNHGGKKGPL